MVIKTKYFQLRTCRANKIPIKINCNRAIDIRYIHMDTAYMLPLWNLVEMESRMEMLYPDILDNPFFMVSKQCFETIKLYEPRIEYRCISLLSKKDSENELYFLPILDEIDCMSLESELNLNKKIIKRLVIKNEAIHNKTIFRVAGFDEPYVIGRLDFVESMLRRKMKGIILTEVEVRSENGN